MAMVFRTWLPLNSDSSVSVCSDNGNGTFRSAVTYSVSKYYHSVVVGDFNGDGKSDLAIGMNNAATLAILIGKGDGTFQAPFTFRLARLSSPCSSGF